MTFGAISLVIYRFDANIQWTQTRLATPPGAVRIARARTLAGEPATPAGHEDRMARRRLVRQLVSATLMALVSHFGTAARAHAQPPPDDPNDGIPAQMCGNGQTFTVSLPGDPNGLDIDDNT